MIMLKILIHRMIISLEQLNIFQFTLKYIGNLTRSYNLMAMHQIFKKNHNYLAMNQ